MPEISLCVPTLEVCGPLCQAFVQSVRMTLSDFSYETIFVENNHPPQGYTDPTNAAIRASRGDYIVVVNDDVQLLDGWWPPLRAALDAGVAIAMPFAQDRQKYGFWLFAMARATMERLEWLPGEFLDRRFKIWYSDTDLQARVQAMGLNIAHVPESKVLHGETKSHDPSEALTSARITEDARLYYLKWPQ